MSKNIKIKYICPIIGMRNTGKSTILKKFLNIDYLDDELEASSRIVTIIRYNALIPKPKFFKLTLKNDGNNNYNFYKNDDSEVIGGENIKNKINIINKELDKHYPDYENIFYMLETCEDNCIDKNFLKDNDFADITFYKKEMITQIFNIIKNKINKGIFVFSLDNYLLTGNNVIIENLKLALNKPIENFLLLDKSENIEKDLDALNQKLVEECPNDVLNITRNTIIPCSAFQLENELKMEKEFTNLLYYHYINYTMDSKKYNNFIDYLKNFLSNYLRKEVENIESEEFERNLKSIRDDEELKKIQYIIKRIKNNHDTIKYNLRFDERDFTEENIQNCIDNLDDLNEDEDGLINLPDQTNSIIIILYYYYLYKNKKIKLFKSHETKTILEYFTLQNTNNKSKNIDIQTKLKEIKNEDILNQKSNNIETKLNEFFDIYKNGGLYLNHKEVIKNSLDIIKTKLKSSEYFYIPLLGASKSGKSTILNDIIGYELLPINKGTKKGMLIVHWDYDFPIIRKAKLICEKTENNKDNYYFKLNNDIIAEGDNNVKKY